MSDSDDLSDVFGDPGNFVIEGVLQWIMHQEMSQEEEIYQVSLVPITESGDMRTQQTPPCEQTLSQQKRRMVNTVAITKSADMRTLPQQEKRRVRWCYKKFSIYSSKLQRNFESPLWAEGILEVLSDFIIGLGAQPMTIDLAEKLAIDCNNKRKENGSRGEEITARQAQQWIWNERKRGKPSAASSSMDLEWKKATENQMTFNSCKKTSRFGMKSAVSWWSRRRALLMNEGRNSLYPASTKRLCVFSDCEKMARWCNFSSKHSHC